MVFNLMPPPPQALLLPFTASLSSAAALPFPAGPRDAGAAGAVQGDAPLGGLIWVVSLAPAAVVLPLRFSGGAVSEAGAGDGEEAGLVHLREEGLQAVVLVLVLACCRRLAEGCAEEGERLPSPGAGMISFPAGSASSLPVAGG